MQAWPMPQCSVFLSIQVSVTFVYSVKTNKHIFKVFQSSSHTILVFPQQTLWQYADGALNAGGVGKNLNSWHISGYRIDDCFSANNCDGNSAVYCTHRHASVILFITTSMDDQDEKKRTEQIWIVHSGKSEAEIVLDIL